MNGQVLEKVSQHGETVFDIYDKLSSNRTLFLSELIYDEVASGIVATLFLLDSISHDQITIILNSEGGDIQDILSIYDAMNIIQSPKRVLCVGSAMEQTSLILAAGTKGLRSATQNAVIAPSKINFNRSNYSDLTDAKITMDQIKKYNKIYLSCLSKCSGKKVADLEKDLEKTRFMSPPEAIKYGLIDNVMKNGKSNKKDK